MLSEVVTFTKPNCAGIVAVMATFPPCAAYSVSRSKYTLSSTLHIIRGVL